MKKYRVVTDNLDWCGFSKGDEIHIDKSGFEKKCGYHNYSAFWLFTPVELDVKGIIKAFEKHPEWFEEIKEEPIKEFNIYNMKSFGLFCKSNPNWTIEKSFDYWRDLANLNKNA